MDSDEDGMRLTGVRAYTGALSFSESDATEALRLVGARGGSPALRLGLPPDTPVDRLAAYAYQRGNHWAVQVIDPGHSGATRRACRIVQRSLDALIAELGSE